MTYTGTYTATFRPCTYTRPTDLHAAPVPERGRTYTDTYTTYTRPDLHARSLFYRRERVSGKAFLVTMTTPERTTP